VEVGDGGPGPVKAQHLTVELTSLAPQVAIGGSVQAGLVFTLEEHWHVYWINAGDSGEPPQITWTLPAGYHGRAYAVSATAAPAAGAADGLWL
jgi:DsbC/DsbD-like thiol-disulfide interchange protein